MQVFEFHGCYFHGCPKCFKTNRDEPLHDNKHETLDSRLEATEARTSRLQDFGYHVVEKWECDFRAELISTPEIEDYTSNHPLVMNAPLEPRDAFFGGRTGNCSTFYETEEGEQIRYLDVCSLYPWVSLNL